MADPRVDIQENEIFELSPELLDTLLKDHTLSTETEQVNIFWATDNYAERGEGYQYNDQIKTEAITGVNGDVIVPRAVKSKRRQKQRSREMAEIFTPSWLCNSMNNLVDNAWFERENVFNTPVDNPDGTHTWIVNSEPVTFPEGKTWRDYVTENRLEITCGEAPFIVSRYDTVTGEPIPVERRIGFLDRKLRIVNENTTTDAEWLKAAREAFMGSYGYEWQGDNLVLAREALLYTYIDYYRIRFGNTPPLDILLDIAEIISWNVWQMDGLKAVIPNSCTTRRTVTYDLFGEAKETVTPCPGCKKNDIHAHNGIYCLIKDWKEDEVVTFESLSQKK